MQHVAGKISLILFKFLIIFIALSQIISVVWYQDSMNEYQSIGMLTLSLIAIFICVVPIQNRTKSTLTLYSVLCVIGIIASLSIAINYIYSFSEPNWVGFVVNILVSSFFLLMIFVYRKSKGSDWIES